MLKVLIADDEARVCQLIQMLVDWDALNMQVIGTAANGIEALNAAAELLPDILITDIRMPGCDGLELIEKVRQLDTRIEIVIISGYAQFEYAQLAIQKGVGGYLLKPIKKEALITTLEKLGKRIRERQDSEDRLEHLKMDGQKHTDLLRERLLTDLIDCRLSLPVSGQADEEYGFVQQPSVFQVFIIKVDHSHKTLSDFSVEIIKEKTEEILAAEVFPLCFKETLCFRHSMGYGLLQFETGKKGEIRKRLRECLNQLEAQKSFFGPVEFTLSLGETVDGVTSLPVSMQTAKYAIAERFVEGTGRLFEPVSAAGRLGLRSLLDRYNRTIAPAVDSLNREEAERVVWEMQEAVKQTADVRGYELLELVKSAAGLFLARLNPEEETAVKQDFELQCELCSKDEQLFGCLKKLQNDELARMMEQHRNEATRPIRLARQYIGQHYMEAITLEDVCAAIGFSVSYFSTLFKKETGEGFSKYLTRVRMEQAKLLLQDTDCPVAEICERVGYSDLKHFTGNFKKITGLNPGQYRKLYG